MYMYVCVYMYVPPIDHVFIHMGMDIYLSEWMENKGTRGGDMFLPVSHRGPGLLACLLTSIV